MILSLKETKFLIPTTSKCIIHTTGTISDGDKITITSPVFASMNYTSGAINTTEKFNVEVKLPKPITNNGSNTLYGTLVCIDNDIFNMHVLIQ